MRREDAVRQAIKTLGLKHEVAQCLFEIWSEVDGAYADEVADLRARLKAVRSQSRAIPQWHLLDRATDLRRRNWRES